MNISHIIQLHLPDPQSVVVAAPKIAQIVSYMSFQKKKKRIANREIDEQP
jgi:hypothetical protein